MQYRWVRHFVVHNLCQSTTPYFLCCYSMNRRQVFNKQTISTNYLNHVGAFNKQSILQSIYSKPRDFFVQHHW